MVYLFLERNLQTLVHKIEELEAELTFLRAQEVDDYRRGTAANAIAYLKEVFASARTAIPERGSAVGIGSVVKVKYFLGQGHEKKRRYEEFGAGIYEIGSYLVLSGGPRIISYDSLIGRALLGALPGQTRKVDPGAVDTGAGKMPTDFLLEVLEVVNDGRVLS